MLDRAQLNTDDLKVIAIDRLRLPYKLFRDLEAVSTKKWLVKDLLGTTECSAFYGAPGSGKSVLVEDLALHVSAGKPWHGRAVEQGAVVFVALERRLLTERRAIAFRKYHGIEDLPFAIVGGVYDFRDAKTSNAILKIVSLVEEDLGQKCVLIVVDTVSRALTGGDENSPKDMGGVITTLGRIQEKTKAHLLVVHHVPIDSERLRGHGSLLGAMDTTVNVQKHSDDTTRSATVAKANDSEEGMRVTFTLESIDIGPETKAPVVIPAEDMAPAGKQGRRLSPKHQLALAALAETTLSSGQTAPAGFDLPTGVRVVEIENWKAELYRRNVLDKLHANPRTDFKRLADKLAACQLIGTRDNFVWSAS